MLKMIERDPKLITSRIGHFPPTRKQTQKGNFQLKGNSFIDMNNLMSTRGKTPCVPPLNNGRKKGVITRPLRGARMPLPNLTGKNRETNKKIKK